MVYVYVGVYGSEEKRAADDGCDVCGWCGRTGHQRERENTVRTTVFESHCVDPILSLFNPMYVPIEYIGTNNSDNDFFLNFCKHEKVFGKASQATFDAL